MFIEGIRIQNYKLLRNIGMGRVGNDEKHFPLTPLTVIIGENNSGKSTFFEVLNFLADCVATNVEKACAAPHRHSLKTMLSTNEEKGIHVAMSYRENTKEPPITYELSIAPDDDQRPYVQGERLYQQKANKQRLFLELHNGKGKASGKPEKIELVDNRMLGISVLGLFTNYPQINRFHRFIESWRFDTFAPNAAHNILWTEPQAHLNTNGGNLANVVRFMEESHPQKLRQIVQRLTAKMSDIAEVCTEKTIGGRLVLYIRDAKLGRFPAQQVSDSVLRVLAYFLLLEDPEPPALICIKEPENGLHPRLVETLAREFRAAASRKENAPQIFVITNSSYFLDALTPEEVWVFKRGEEGFSTTQCAAEY